MKRVVYLATAALVAMLILVPVATAQQTVMMEETKTMEKTEPLPKSGGPAVGSVALWDDNRAEAGAGAHEALGDELLHGPSGGLVADAVALTEFHRSGKLISDRILVGRLVGTPQDVGAKGLCHLVVGRGPLYLHCSLVFIGSHHFRVNPRVSEGPLTGT